jgi:hypothetical protein
VVVSFVILFKRPEKSMVCSFDITGSCHGRAFFCDTPCLKEGWKEHKQRHKCQKKAGGT